MHPSVRYSTKHVTGHHAYAAVVAKTSPVVVAGAMGYIDTRDVSLSGNVSVCFKRSHCAE